MRWRPANTPVLMLSLILITLGLLVILWPEMYQEPPPQGAFLVPLLISIILIASGMILPFLKWRRR